MNENRKWDLQAGYGQIEITPKPGHSLMAGYGVDRIANGTELPLISQVLYLKDQNRQEWIWITADIIGFDRTTTAALKYSISEKYNIPQQHVVCCASHTHWGPATLYSIGLSCGAINPWYVFEMEDKILSAVDTAVNNSGPARMQYQATDVKIGVNRRKPGKDGKIEFAPNPDGHYDAHTPVIFIERHNTSEHIIITGHACHPTSSGGDMQKWSPDYPGYMRRYINRIHPQYKVMFIMGCGADAKVAFINDKNEYQFAAHPNQACEGGEKLAKAIIEAINNKPFVSLSGEIMCNEQNGSLTLGQKPTDSQIKTWAVQSPRHHFETAWARQMLSMKKDIKEIPYNITTWKIADTLSIIFMEGEVCGHYGPLGRSLTKTEYAMTVGYTNAVDGYIPSQEIRKQGGYEGHDMHKAFFLPAPFTESVEDEIVTLLKRSLEF